MSIYGIGSRGMGNYFSYYSALSQVRLQQALQKNPKYQSAVEAVSGVDKVTSGSSFKSTSMDFLKSYSSTMSDVMQSANSLRKINSGGVMNDYDVSSSDTDIAQVSERYPQRGEKSMELTVDQLATAQKNTSDSVTANAKAIADMNFTIDSNSGKYDSIQVNVSAAKENGAMKTNREMLKEAMNQINSSKSGVTASIMDKDGQATLEIKTKDTGTAAAFTVSGDLGAAAGVENAAVDAQNAEYTVTTGETARNYTSQSNEVQLDYGKINASLKGTGTTTIRSAVDSEKVASSVSDLVKNYNKAIKFLDDNASHGQGVVNVIGNFVRNLAGDKSLDQVGITTQKDGTLKLDKEKLVESLKKDPDLTKEILSGTNGIAQKAFSRASSAMTTRSTSLISNDLQEINNTSFTDPYTMLNLYSKNGAYNMNNLYATGMFMNYLA